MRYESLRWRRCRSLSERTASIGPLVDDPPGEPETGFRSANYRSLIGGNISTADPVDCML